MVRRTRFAWRSQVGRSRPEFPPPHSQRPHLSLRHHQGQRPHLSLRQHQSQRPRLRLAKLGQSGRSPYRRSPYQRTPCANHSQTPLTAALCGLLTACSTAPLYCFVLRCVGPPANGYKASPGGAPPILEGADVSLTYGPAGVRGCIPHPERLRAARLAPNRRGPQCLGAPERSSTASA
jgi:hypothetical protein